MKTKENIEKNYFKIDDEILNEESFEVPEFIHFPESAPISPVKVGYITMILPWCC